MKRIRRRSGSTIAFPFFPAYPADWLSSGTRAQLTTEQVGIFWELCFHAWLEEDCGLPNDERTLAAYARLTQERWDEVGRPVIELAFNVSSNGRSTPVAQKRERLFNKRLLKERRIAEGRSRQASRAGRKSGEVRAKAKKKRP